MRRVLLSVTLIALLGFSLFLSACGSSGAKELFETAKFEELQNNKEHARELYGEVMKKYPKSEYARQAEERLKTLERKD